MSTASLLAQGVGELLEFVGDVLGDGAELLAVLAALLALLPEEVEQDAG